MKTATQAAEDYVASISGRISRNLILMLQLDRMRQSLKQQMHKMFSENASAIQSEAYSELNLKSQALLLERIELGKQAMHHVQSSLDIVETLKSHAQK